MHQPPAKLWIPFVFIVWLFPCIALAQPIEYQGQEKTAIGFGAIHYLGEGDTAIQFQQAKQLFRSGKFKQNTLSDLNLGISKENYWIHFKIMNKVGKQTLFIQFENPRLNQLVVYRINDTLVKDTLVMGDYYPFSNRPVYSNLFVYPFELESGESSEFFVHILHKGSTLQLPITLLEANGLYKSLQSAYLLTGFVSGILILTIFFGIFFYFNSYNPLFIFYSLYSLSVLVWLGATEGYFFQYLYPNHPVWATKTGPPVSVIALGFFMATCMEFCKGYDPKGLVRRILYILSMVVILAGILPLLPWVNNLEPRFMSSYMQVHFIFNFLFILVLSIYLLVISIQKNTVVLFYFFAVVTSMAASVMVIGRHSGYINLPISSGSFMTMGIMVEIVLMTAGITRQFYLYKQEKEKILLSYLEQQKQINQQILDTQDRERRRISKELHDDFGAGLTLITLLSENARKQNGQLGELQEIANTGRKLAGSMKEIIWSMDPETKTLEQLVIYLREELGNLLEVSEMDYQFNFPSEIPDISLLNQQRRNLLLVAKESVNNAIKYSEATFIEIGLRVEEFQIWLWVQDNGKGFDVNEKKKGNGLKNMAYRMKEMEGKFTISSNEKGTKTEFILNVEKM